MKKEEQVTSLELSKKLKELGVKQESLFNWLVLDANHPLCRVHETTSAPERLKEALNGQLMYGRDPYEKMCGEFIHYSAFTVAELGEIIHNHFNEWAQGWSDSGCFYHFRFGLRGSGSMIEGCGKSFEAEEETEVNARATLIIYLIENGLLKHD